MRENRDTYVIKHPSQSLLDFVIGRARKKEEELENLKKEKDRYFPPKK
ncbi:MAG: hypothetical protein LBK45_02130 [Tannerellaceae bacterium]|jgi:hypothetical protein|nr:hypothetical protein [Tannerellaceae bacterium]